MIHYSTASIFDSPAQTLVNPCNCVGVMGAGLAKEFKARHPFMFADYAMACAYNGLAPGDLHLYKVGTPWVLCAATKGHWRDKSRIEWVTACLDVFARDYEELGITSVAWPKLGCGLGGLDWRDVKPVMEERLGGLGIEVWIHE
jgi:O-acetyl-ADP-ribose deacetylase (regulator of RNase III)